MLTEVEQAYLSKRSMQRLTFDGINDLYLHPLYGARTIENCIALDDLKRPLPCTSPYREILISEELSIRNERCIDECGCGLFSPS